MGDKKKFALNFAAQIAVLGTQFIISFVLTPIVLQKLGDEAYGFVGLVNNFVSYVAIITAALNAMASRFITVSYHEGIPKGPKSISLRSFSRTVLWHLQFSWDRCSSLLT